MAETNTVTQIQPLLLYILLSPLIGAFVVGIFGHIFKRQFPARLAELIATAAPMAAFFCVVALAFQRSGAVYFPLMQSWIPFGVGGHETISLALFADDITQLMLFLITGVGTLIHIYSIGYMHEDPSRHRFFAYLNLFVFFMLLLVLSNNLLSLFVGWEGVGLCSYLLIGFWYSDTENAIAGKKAFIVNRVGDAAFILGMLMLLTQFGTLNVHDVGTVSGGLANLVSSPSALITAATLLLFIGAVGKSAQFPLLVWLPDAMAGPTPVSALIHAATMVTAGVYMVVRLNFMFVLAPTTLAVIAAIGLFTAFFAACAALGQRDIKRVLAYSTVSQLGYMFLGLGVGAFSASMFHLITHGFFKALLFLSAGSVIHATHGEQDMYRMGGLKNYLIPTTVCFAAGSLALSGFPFLSGWFSKGAILGSVYASGHVVYWGIGVLTAVITAIYTIKLFCTVFLGTPNMSKEGLGKVHESPTVMIAPMGLLAVLSAIGGYGFLGVSHLAESANIHAEHAAEHHHMMATIIETAAIVAAIFLAWRLFTPAGKAVAKESAFQKSAEKAFYLDYVVTKLLGQRFTMAIANMSRWFELHVVDGIVNGSAVLTRQLGWAASVAQRSNVKTYMYTMVVGSLIILWLVIWK